MRSRQCRRQLWLIGSFASMLLLVFGQVSCRSGRHGVRAGGDTVSLKVTLNSFQAGDEGHTEWIYEMSGCIPAVNGVLDSDAGNVVTFKSGGIKLGLSDCSVRVTSVTPPSPNAIARIPTDPTLIYWSKQFSITQTADGELVASVEIRQAYEIQIQAEKSFTLKVAVKFPEVESSPKILAYLDCNPKIANPGIYPQGNPIAGEFTFNASIEAGTSFKCSGIEVLAGNNVYKGEFTGSDGTFTARGGQAVSLKTVTLKLVPPTVTGDGGITVDTTPGTCPDDSVFDTTSRTCVKRK